MVGGGRQANKVTALALQRQHAIARMETKIHISTHNQAALGHLVTVHPAKLPPPLCTVRMPWREAHHVHAGKAITLHEVVQTLAVQLDHFVLVGSRIRLRSRRHHALKTNTGSS